ncbi:T-box transcription factor TBX6 [Eumeta japonica]|uniref:T-box transcription factor TBX6 n=1 Tax=Eumeta variegata TaxID=151549 RepID=A0A4C1XC52_EUMVA|nr:T-box transcription factor TBX6 [Eumeta japonica]
MMRHFKTENPQPQKLESTHIVLKFTNTRASEILRRNFLKLISSVRQQMVLTSMHKYRPRVVVVRARDAAALAWGAPHAAFSFPETEFIAVTAYQIRRLRIHRNRSVILGTIPLRGSGGGALSGRRRQCF